MPGFHHEPLQAAAGAKDLSGLGPQPLAAWCELAQGLGRHCFEHRYAYAGLLPRLNKLFPEGSAF
jgi:hypothetical protein